MLFLRTNQDGCEQFIPPPGIIANFVSTRPIFAEEAKKEGRKLSNIHIVKFMYDDLKRSVKEAMNTVIPPLSTSLLSPVSLTQGQTLSENVKWKILETKSS